MLFEQYLTKQQIQQHCHRGRTWTANLIREIEHSDRYPPEVIIRDGYLVMVHELAVLDWMRNKKAIKKGELIAPFELRG